MTVTGGIERMVLAALLDTPGDHIAAAAAALRKIVMRLAAGELVGGGVVERSLKDRPNIASCRRLG